MTRIAMTMLCLSCILGGAAMTHAEENRTLREDSARHDIHSAGNPSQVRVKHIDLDLLVVFTTKELVGTAGLRLEWAPDAPKNTPLILDTRDLKIGSIEASVKTQGMKPVPFEIGKPDSILGTPLIVHVPDRATEVVIHYKTSPGATALQWLDPPRTAGRKRPFLFSQGQAIHTRSWIPCQDSPGVRVTYNATIRVPEGLAAVMSADRAGQEGNATKFTMTEAIPPYLIALAVGDLVFRPLGKRTGVWAEPSVIDRAVYEFADTEKMVEATEKRYGPYRWGRYDILVLPPSFPFGGMENPKLTFATPTVLAGDRSLVALIAHELAHSWSGNLVTNATWRDFWLNEGVTTYLERRIVEDVYGAEMGTMEQVLGKQDLLAEIAEFEPKDEILHIDLKGRDPDDGMTRIPYEKGALLLKKLEMTAGRAKFDAFLKDYFDHFAFQSITTADFEKYVREKLFAPGREPIDLHDWIHNAGIPSDAPEPTSPRLDELSKLATSWSQGKSNAASLNAKDWSTIEWLRFLRAFPAKLSSEKMAELDSAYNLTDRGNAEIAEQWLLLAIQAGYKPADGRLEEFLTSVGRRKYLMPLYGELAKTPAGKERAKAIYKKARPYYHPISVESVDRLLGPI